MRGLILLLTIGLMWVPSGADASPRPTQSSGLYRLDILGFNEGDPYRIQEAEADAVLTEKGAAVFRFQSADWMGKKEAGSYVSTTELTKRFASRQASDLIDVFRLDLNQDDQPEYLLVPRDKKIGDKKRYAPTLLKRTDNGFTPMWACRKLPGKRFKVLDIRDMNGDGTPEILLSGEAGRRGYYQFHRLVGLGPSGFAGLPIKHVDSVHYVDLTADGLVEIVVRTRVGRRGPASQWTYIDQLYRWTGKSFDDASKQYPRYHDEETLPALVDDLIDHYDAKLAIRFEKVEAIERVRASTLEATPKPRGFRRKVIKALKALQKQKFKRSKRMLEGLQKNYPYDTQVLMGLAKVYSHESKWDSVLDSAVRALTIAPRLREAWWQASIAFTHLSERSSARASLHNAVQICGKTREGIAFLKARQNEKGLHPNLKDAITHTLRILGDKAP